MHLGDVVYQDLTRICTTRPSPQQSYFALLISLSISSPFSNATKYSLPVRLISVANDHTAFTECVSPCRRIGLYYFHAQRGLKLAKKSMFQLDQCSWSENCIHLFMTFVSISEPHALVLLLDFGIVWGPVDTWKFPKVLDKLDQIQTLPFIRRRISPQQVIKEGSGFGIMSNSLWTNALPVIRCFLPN
mmetsp:Transcript_43259/g.79132  ORF Transcript_43259/g.79132 Transcript_43259/m.79132 type:complete len:188 (+) Transcript_43259:34-597(+)